MYGITKTRMLLTTVVFAAVAAMFAAGASARIPADTSSDFAAQESLGIGRFAVLPSVTKVAEPSGTNARIPADTSSAFAAQESLRIGRYLAKPSVTKVAQESGTFSVEEICAALGLEQLRGVLINEDAIKSATPGVIQECSHARAAKSIAPVLASSEATQGVSESAVVSRSDVVSRYLDSNRTRTSQKRVARPRTNKFPDGRRSVP